MTRPTALQVLRDVEEIKQLKARYFRLLDLKRWDEWGELFAENATLSAARGDLVGRSNIVDGVSGALDGARTVHQGHMPEIEVTSSTTARGIWSLHDYVDRRSGDGVGEYFVGYGRYSEDYVKEGKPWRIAALRLTRLRVDLVEVHSDLSSSQHSFFSTEEHLAWNQRRSR
jgi:3-phenylpropionate/cinnamic acid dioxygenase small subunit